VPQKGTRVKALNTYGQQIKAFKIVWSHTIKYLLLLYFMTADTQLMVVSNQNHK
jgi:hypothetical protein